MNQWINTTVIWKLNQSTQECMQFKTEAGSARYRTREASRRRAQRSAESASPRWSPRAWVGSRATWKWQCRARWVQRRAPVARAARPTRSDRVQLAHSSDASPMTSSEHLPAGLETRPEWNTPPVNPILQLSIVIQYIEHSCSYFFLMYTFYVTYYCLQTVMLFVYSLYEVNKTSFASASIRISFPIPISLSGNSFVPLN